MHFRQNVWVSRRPSSSKQLHFQRPCSLTTFNRPKATRQLQRQGFRGLISQTRRYSSGGFQVLVDKPLSQNQDEEAKDAQLVGPAEQANLDIAVLGAGVTGLATAYFLTRKFPNAKVTIVEKQPTLGGWIQTKTARVPGGEITFEQGPRTLRPSGPNGQLMLQVMRELDLLDEVLITPKSSPAAGNRFIYYPDHLVRLGVPKNLKEFVQLLVHEPITKGILRWGINDFLADARVEHEVHDESVGEFLSRRLGRGFVDRIASAGLHGIYAGDVWKLSARSVMPLLWATEPKFESFGSQIWSSAWKGERWDFCDDLALFRHLEHNLPRINIAHPETGVEAPFTSVCSVYTLEKGLGQLTKAFEERLTRNKNVRILRSTTAKEMSKMTLDRISLRLENSTGKAGGSLGFQAFHQVISTINPRSLHRLMDKDTLQSFKDGFSDGPGPAQAEPHAVTVMLVNLYFQTPSLLSKTAPPGGLPSGLGAEGLRGFGYLIPSDVPYEQNPECALGVIFDSDISQLHSTLPRESQGTKLTVMMGGHLWDGLDRYPTPDEATAQALALLHRHLGVSEAPVATNAVLQRECIPQYLVGHAARMDDAHYAYLRAYAGLLKVAGSWYSGVGVNDCVRAAYNIVQSLADCVSPSSSSSSSSSSQLDAPPDRTGLRQFTSWGRPMVKYKVHRPHPNHHPPSPSPSPLPPILQVLEMEPKAKSMGYTDADFTLRP